MARRTNCMGVPFVDEGEDADDQDEEVEETEEGEGEETDTDDLGETERELESLQRTRVAARDGRTRALGAVAAALRALADALEQLDGEPSEQQVVATVQPPRADAAEEKRRRRGRQPTEDSLRVRILRLLSERREPVEISDIASTLKADRQLVTRRLFDLTRKLEVRKLRAGLYEAVKS